MFKPNFTKTFDFQGEKITVVFKRMSRKHAIMASPMIDAGEALGIEKSLEFMGISAEILKECIKSIAGLKRETESGIQEYSAGSKEFEDEVLEGSYFISLISEMISELMSESFLKEDDKKKSDQPLSESITA